MEVYANTLMLIQMCESECGGYISHILDEQCLNVKVAHLVKHLQNIHLIRPSCWHFSVPPAGADKYLSPTLSLATPMYCTQFPVIPLHLYVCMPCADCRSLSLYQMKATSVGFLVSRCRLSVNRKWAVGQGHGQVLQLSLGKRWYSFRWTTPGEKKS